jgi:hypothetical protein
MVPSIHQMKRGARPLNFLLLQKLQARDDGVNPKIINLLYLLNKVLVLLFDFFRVKHDTPFQVMLRCSNYIKNFL